MADSGSYLLSTPLATPPDPAEHTWKPLRFLNLYRLFLGGLFVFLVHVGRVPTPLGKHDLELFYWVSLAYVGFAVVSNFAIHYRRPDFDTQVYLHVSIDIVVITLLMHASGGIESGIGMLLVVSIAGAGMLTAGRTAGLFAALATFAMMAEQLHSHFSGLADFASYPRAGMLGATLFATAILARVLARRIRESEALAAQRGLDLANMARLTEYVIQQMEAGVLVVDGSGGIRLMNDAAWQLLGQPRTAEQRTLESVSSALARALWEWRAQGGTAIHTLPAADGSHELLPRFVRIGEQPAGYLIFLIDATLATHQAQQLKLAALGRLTASIAHEIRNPLAAISHAGQLLAESPGLDRGDRRLTEIIGQQSLRVNAIIETVLQLGRRDRSRPESVPLAPWLARFVEEFVETTQCPREGLAISVEPMDLAVRFDPDQLRQVLWNLCRNGLHHAREARENPKVVLQARREGLRAWLDVIDHGPGVSETVRPHLFEPFFTTESGGTGLGLYISRELAQCNRARLDYLPMPEGGGRFRLSFGPVEQTEAA